MSPGQRPVAGHAVLWRVATQHSRQARFGHEVDQVSVALISDMALQKQESRAREIIEVAGLTGRASVANGLYQYGNPSVWKGGKRAYTQLGLQPNEEHTVHWDAGTPDAQPAWILERPNDPGKCWAYAEVDSAKPDEVPRNKWQVFMWPAGRPLEEGRFKNAPHSFWIRPQQQPPQQLVPRAGRPSRSGTPPRTSRPEIEMQGHLYSELDGVYTYTDANHYVNAVGRHLYKPHSSARWVVSNKFTPESDECLACVDTAVELPMGGNMWHCLNDALQRWEKHRIMTTAIRPRPRPSASSQQQQQTSAGGMGRNAPGRHHATPQALLLNERLHDYARSIGIDPQTEQSLMYLAEAGYKAPLPPGWEAGRDKNGRDVYRDLRSGKTCWEHPEDAYYTELVVSERAKLRPVPRAGGRTNDTGGRHVGEDDGGVLDATLQESLRVQQAAEAQRRAADELAEEETIRALEASRLSHQESLARQRELSVEQCGAEALKLGYEADLVAQVQKDGQFEELPALLERLSQLQPEPEPEVVPAGVLLGKGGQGSQPEEGALWTGLPNPSNYCFLNTVLQCLRHTPSFSRLIIGTLHGVTKGSKGNSGGWGKRSNKPATLLEALALLLARMQRAGEEGGVQVKTPERQDFIDLCATVLPEEPDEDGRRTRLVLKSAKKQLQQDAGEFLLQLLSQLCEDRENGASGGAAVALRLPGARPPVALAPDFGDAIAKRLTATKPNSAEERAVLAEYIGAQWAATQDSTVRTELGRLFQGQELTYKACVPDKSCHVRNGCGLFSPSSADPMLVDEMLLAHHAIVRKRRASLLDLIKICTEKEVLEGFKCDSCKAISTTNKCTVLVRLPSVYIVRLNRRTHDEQRVTCSIDFPDELDLSPRMHIGVLGPPIDFEGNPCSTKFRLYGAIFHYGRSTREGHYFAMVRRGLAQQKAATSNGSCGGGWVYCSDSDVEACERQNDWTPQKEEHDPGSRYGVCARATLLFYERRPLQTHEIEC
eukprot:COSAG05_NODE_208_length_14084_cov_4.973671_2_plen_998_part_00